MTAPRKPMLFLALLLAGIKAVQFAIDSTPLLTIDSGAFVDNGLRVLFYPTRSYVYGYLIRICALRFHSLRPLVVVQIAMGGISAWLLGFILIRYFRVRPWIAIAAALVFAFDPVQMVYERAVMTETAALLAMAVFLTMACAYLDTADARWLMFLSLAGILMVSLRLVYVPLVLAAAALLPVAAYLVRRGLTRQSLVVALMISCGWAAIFHVGYRHLTGWLGNRAPAYHFQTGFFLMSAVAPLIGPEDADDPRVRQAILEQNETPVPLANRDFRSAHLWNPPGLSSRLKTAFAGDEAQADDAAGRLANRAILREPVGFLKLGWENYADYWTHLRYAPAALDWEVGIYDRSPVNAPDAALIQQHFGLDASGNYRLRTLSRRLFLHSAAWLYFLLLSPFLAGIALLLPPWDGKGSVYAALFFVWSWLLTAATVMGAVAYAYRFLHPFSFLGIAGTTFLAEKIASERRAARRGATS
jgi:hypothetical protein